MAEVHSIHIKVDSTEANRASNDLNKMAGATSNAEKALGNLIGIAKGLVALETLRRVASYAVEAADSFTNMSSKLKLATSSQADYNKAQSELFKIAQQNSTSLEDTVQLYSRLATGMKDMGKSQAETLRMTDLVGKALRISGASASETSSVITQFSQAIGSGVLRGEEFNAIMENGNRLARALADGIGVPIGQLRKLAEAGQLTGDVVVKAIMSQQDALDSQASMMQTTVSQAWVQLQNAITQYIGQADQANGTSAELANTIVVLAKNFKDLADPIATAVAYIAKVEIGGWLALSEAIQKASVNLKEMVGIQQGGTTDAETLAIMKKGMGQVPISDLAEKQAQATEQAVAKSAKAVGLHLANTGKAAKKTADDAERAFQATIQANVSAAENAAKLQDAQAETAKKRLENELQAAEEKAKLDSKDVQSQEEKLKIAEELQKKSEEIIAKETELRLQSLDAEAQILAVKIAGIEQEIAAADKYNLTQAERIRLQTELASLQTQQQIIPEQKTQVELDAIKELTSATAELNQVRKDGETNVRDEALRTLAVMQSNLDFAQEMASGFTDAFGSMGDAVGGFIVALAEYEKQMATIRVQMEEDIAKNPSKRYEIEQKAAEKSAKAQIKSYGDMTQSAQKFFKQGTKGYEAMGAATKVFRAFEMAQSAISVAKQIDEQGGLINFFTTSLQELGLISAQQTEQQIADASSKATADATAGAAHQGTAGDPYTAFARVAAWVALMAGLGIMIAGGGGGGGAPAAPPPDPGTGTVFGDPTAQSESISKSLEILTANSSNDLNYSSGMLQALLDIKDAIKGVENLIAADLTPAISELSAKYGADAISQAGFIFRDQSLQKILSTGMMQGYIGARIDTTTGADMLPGVEIKKGQTLIAKMGDEFARAFGRAIITIRDSIVEAGKVIGISAETIAERLKKFTVKGGIIDIAGLSAADAAKKVEAFLSATSDRMAKIALPEFKDFQRSGEGYKETVVRVAEGISRAKGELALLGMEAINYTDITKKNRDVAAEIARQTIIAQGELGAGANAYIQQLTGSSADIIEVYKQLKDIQGSFRAIGINSDKINQDLINAAGGVTALQDALTTFVNDFLTPTEQVKKQAKELQDSFSRIGIAMPKTRDEFADLIRSLDDTSRYTDKTKGQILALIPAYSEYINNLEDLQQTMKDLSASVTDLMGSIQSDIAGLAGSGAELGLAADSVASAWADVNSYIDSVKNGATRNVNTEIDLLNTLRSSVMSRYNAELSAIRDAAQKQADQIRNATASQIESIKSASEAQINAINDNATTQIDAINLALDAEMQAKQKAHEEALKALQTEYEAASKLKNAVDAVKQYAAAMGLGPNAPTSPEQRIQEAQRQYVALLQRAQGGDADAISQLSGAADTYLQAAKDYYGSGTQYTNIFDGVKQAMEAIGAMNVADPDSIQSKIDLLRESQKDELDAIKKRAQEQIDAIKDAQKANVQSVKDAADAQTKAIQQASQEQISALTDPDQNQAIAALKASTIAELERIYTLSEAVKAEANRQAEAVNAIAELQLYEMRNQTSLLATIAGNAGTTPAATDTGGTTTNKSVDSSVASIATETKASVNLQKNAYPKMIAQLQSIDDRLSKIERTQRLNA